MIEITSPTFVALAKVASFAIKNPAWTATLKGNAVDAPAILKEMVSTADNN